MTWSSFHAERVLTKLLAMEIAKMINTNSEDCPYVDVQNGISNNVKCIEWCLSGFRGISTIILDFSLFHITMRIGLDIHFHQTRASADQVRRFDMKRSTVIGPHSSACSGVAAGRVVSPSRLSDFCACLGFVSLTGVCYKKTIPWFMIQVNFGLFCTVFFWS